MHVTARVLIIKIQLHTAPLQIMYNLFNLIMTLSGPEIKTIKKKNENKLQHGLMQGAVPQSHGKAVTELMYS